MARVGTASVSATSMRIGVDARRHDGVAGISAADRADGQRAERRWSTRTRCLVQGDPAQLLPQQLNARSGAAACGGRRRTRYPEGPATTGRALIESPRFEPAVRAFFEDMLQFDKFDDLAKDSVVYPAFNSAVAADAKEQTLRTISRPADRAPGRLSRSVHDTSGLPDSSAGHRLQAAGRRPAMGGRTPSFPKAVIAPAFRSHVAFLALYSHPGRSSPTLRGKAIREVFLCQEVPDPPPNVDFCGGPGNIECESCRPREIAWTCTARNRPARAVTRSWIRWVSRSRTSTASGPTARSRTRRLSTPRNARRHRFRNPRRARAGAARPSGNPAVPR